MSLPANISVSFDFSQGATFGFNGFIIGDAKNGVIGTSQFAASAVPEPVVDLSVSLICSACLPIVDFVNELSVTRLVQSFVL